MKSKKLLLKISTGHYKNIKFRDMQVLLEDIGFELKRVAGSHHIYACAGMEELVNIQNVGGEVKPYQVRQIVKLIERYDLAGD